MEEMSTILCEIESILNSRPLCQLTSQPEDGVAVLTPGHFLIGRPILALPEHESTYSPTTYLKRWKLTSLLAQHFWKRWSQEYLSILQKRNKWSDEQPNLKPGDVVMIKNEDNFLRTWPLAKVIDVHPGSDGLVRAVTLRTSKGTVTRPIHVLVRLVVEEEYEEIDMFVNATPTISPDAPPPGGEDVQG